MTVRTLQSDQELFYPTRQELPLFVALDQLCLGGMWTLAGYEREWDSPNGFLLGIRSKLISPTPQEVSSDITVNSPNLIGMGAFWKILDEAHVTLLAVHPEFRKNGVGSYLLQSLLTTAKTEGLSHATLEVRASNKIALNLYRCHGFREAGRRKKYYSNDEDALILWFNDLQER